MKPKWSPNWPPHWLPTIMPTWLFRQDFAKFSLNRHYNAGYHGRVAHKKPRISAVYRQKRLDFANEHVNKPPQFWEKVLFSDESKFFIFGIKGRKLVWRKQGTTLEKGNLVRTIKHGGGGVMVWGAWQPKIADLSHSVLTPMSFRVEYRRPGGPSMFQRNVRFHADITSAAGPQDINSVGSPGVYCISFTLISGPLRRFKRICEHIQAQILGRKPNTSPRISRRSTNEMSDSSSCGSETLSPTLRVSFDLSVGSRPSHNTGQSGALARCKSDQDQSDLFDNPPPSHHKTVSVGQEQGVSNGRRSNYENKTRV
ncbi:hypothetical protein TNCV_1520981 [Trichonephila clavipes]|nr:hypothetical protein TNCV_1520981 [Trichonephila clavipes]